MADGTGIAEKIKKMAVEAQEARKPVYIYYGKVISLAPLKISVEQKMLLGEKQLVLTRNVTDFSVRVTVKRAAEKEGFASSGEMDAEEMQITVHNGLEIGEEVILIRQQEGQKFIVADRIGGGS